MDLLTQWRGAGIGDVVANVGAIGVGWSCAASTISPLPSGPMTQVMDPTVKIWPGSGKAMELGKRTIWLAMDSARTPSTWGATVDEIRLAVY
jgi:hypothetical protein